jgi:hypothetical protein
LKYYIPYALVVEEKKKKKKRKSNACVRAHTCTIGKKKRRKSVRLLARSLSYRARARNSFLRTSAATQMAMYVL